MPLSWVENIDCMIGMARYPDKYFELAIVDPPYGLNMDENAYNNGINCKANGFKPHKQGKWDKAIPKDEYFKEIKDKTYAIIIYKGNRSEIKF